MIPSQHLLVQNQQEKHQSNMWNLFRVNNKNTRTMSGAFIVNFEKILYIVFVFSMWTLNKWMPAGFQNSTHFIFAVRHMKEASEAYLQPNRTSTMQLLTVNNFSHKKAPSQMSDWVLNTSELCKLFSSYNKTTCSIHTLCVFITFFGASLL